MYLSKGFDSVCDPVLREANSSFPDVHIPNGEDVILLLPANERYHTYVEIASGRETMHAFSEP